jgi:pimeloyl-ACP methyl ester carboxylesterase
MHGFPASGLEAALLDAPARALGIALVAPDRPGFGLSDPLPGRTLLDWPADVAALADALGVDRFRVLGGSAGCPYALAAAHLLRDRVIRVALVAGLGPTDDREAVRRMGRTARIGFALATRAPGVFRLAFGALARLVARYPWLNFYLNEATPPDRAALARPEVLAALDAAAGGAFRQGTAAAVQELALLAAPWGFRPEEIAAPVQIWHGREDGVVPYQMGELLARRLPDARLTLVDGEGHVSLPVRRGADILRSLLAA